MTDIRIGKSRLLSRLLKCRAAADGKGSALGGCRLGATAVEFAILAPVFLLLVVGFIELARAMWIKSTLQFSVEETTRFAMVNTGASEPTLEAYAATKLAGMNSTGVTFNATIDTTVTPNTVTVTAAYSFQSALVPNSLVIPGVGPLVGDTSLSLSATSVAPLP